MPRPAVRLSASALGLALLASACGATTPEPVASSPVVAAAPAPVAPPPPERLTGTAPLTGMAVTPEHAAQLATTPALIVKVENSSAARPQAGLDEADVVFEELVEGGITRFISVFHTTLPDRVGPVRSARPVDVELGSGFGAPVFAYTGARAEVQTMLRGSSMVALEEGQVAGFERDAQRRSPHNVYLRPAEVLAAGRDRGAGAIPDLGWRFDERPPGGEVTCGDPSGCADPGASISVRMSPGSTTGFVYDEAAEVYRRTQDGVPFAVTGEGAVGAANVVVLATRHYLGGCCDSAGSPYPETEVLGEGRAVVLRDGRRYEARWDKPTVEAPLRVLDGAGRPFPFKPGPTWLLLPDAAALP